MIRPRFFQRRSKILQFFLYSTRCHKVFQTSPLKSKTSTPCLYYCSHEIRRAIYQLASGQSVASSVVMKKKKH